MTREHETGCLVIGSGIAGLSAAIALGERGVPVTVITAAPAITETNTTYAQGGIIFEAVTKSAESLANDILEAGCHVNYPAAVHQLAEMGPKLVRELLIEKAGVPFDKESTGGYRLTREGGHSESRILHRGDESGRAIEQALVDYAGSLGNIRFLTKTTAVNLLMTSHHAIDHGRVYEPARCFGAFVFDQQAQEVYPLFAEHTVVATGGIGQLYLHNTNGKFARGDGIALASRAGCRLANLEYMQFHPTTFFQPPARRFLISEALRGEGAVLLNSSGERFLGNFLPGYATPELAPRDRVAWAIHQEMLSTGASCVYLDISFKPAAWIQERFPWVYRSCLEHGVDITKAPIPVVPGAHYLCGGIWTDLDGATSIPSLWAAGETACTGLHGANRLASTSLLEGLVWGTKAGSAIAAAFARGERQKWPLIAEWRSESATVEPSFLKQDWLTLKHTMWNYVGLIKTDARLARARGVLTELARGIETFYRKARLSDELIGLRHAAHTALLVLEACERNHRSLGCYVRDELEI